RSNPAVIAAYLGEEAPAADGEPVPSQPVPEGSST
ncbi:MAG: ABC transporter ATP-binding protein C-terminal domain-containing protein, partial [Solirubrobacteraceae bacterium]